MTLNDLEPLKERFLVNFFAIFGCSAHFNTELRRKDKKCKEDIFKFGVE